jgi:hypothetical protein
VIDNWGSTLNLECGDLSPLFLRRYSASFITIASSVGKR